MSHGTHSAPNGGAQYRTHYRPCAAEAAGPTKSSAEAILLRLSGGGVDDDHGRIHEQKK